MKKNIVLCFERVEKSGRLKWERRQTCFRRRHKWHGGEEFGNVEEMLKTLRPTSRTRAIRIPSGKSVLKMTNICFI